MNYNPNLNLSRSQNPPLNPSQNPPLSQHQSLKPKRKLSRRLNLKRTLPSQKPRCPRTPNPKLKLRSRPQRLTS